MALDMTGQSSGRGIVEEEEEEEELEGDSDHGVDPCGAQLSGFLSISFHFDLIDIFI